MAAEGKGLAQICGEVDIVRNGINGQRNIEIGRLRVCIHVNNAVDLFQSHQAVLVRWKDRVGGGINHRILAGHRIIGVYSARREIEDAVADRQDPRRA